MNSKVFLWTLLFIYLFVCLFDFVYFGILGLIHLLLVGFDICFCVFGCFLCLFFVLVYV